MVEARVGQGAPGVTAGRGQASEQELRRRAVAQALANGGATTVTRVTDTGARRAHNGRLRWDEAINRAGRRHGHRRLRRGRLIPGRTGRLTHPHPHPA
jgi:hypothetical protein